MAKRKVPILESLSITGCSADFVIIDDPIIRDNTQLMKDYYKRASKSTLLNQERVILKTIIQEKSLLNENGSVKGGVFEVYLSEAEVIKAGDPACSKFKEV